MKKICKKIISLAFLFCFTNLVFSTIYYNNFHPEIVQLKERFAAGESVGACSQATYDQNSTSWVRGSCSGGVLKERDDLLDNEGVWISGGWYRERPYHPWDDGVSTGTFFFKYSF